MKQETEDRTGRWTQKEHMAFLEGLNLYGRNWSKVAQLVKTRTSTQVRSHAQKHELRERAARNPVKQVVHHMPRPLMVDKQLQYGEGVRFEICAAPADSLDFQLVLG